MYVVRRLDHMNVNINLNICLRDELLPDRFSMYLINLNYYHFKGLMIILQDGEMLNCRHTISNGQTRGPNKTLKCA